MQTLFILFIASLFGIIFMIGRKLAFVRNEQILGREDVIHPFVPDLEKIKHLAKQGVKQYGRMTLVATIRMYIKSTNLLKQKSTEVKDKVVGMMSKNNDSGDSPTTQEPSKFLTMVSEYKHKIREIKHRVKKEEEKDL